MSHSHISRTTSNGTVLSEQLIQDSFHSYLKSSLTQAKAERLLDEDILSSAEADLMITGPALCLYFAALRCTTDPPSVPLPRSKGSGTNKAPMDLSYENCPPVFSPFLRVWAKNVPAIQALAPEYQHDLARIICGLDPLTQPLNPSINGISADLRGVAIEISQRRSFQERYASALQSAIDASVGSGSRPSPKRASFVPPPSYDQPPTATTTSSPRPSLDIPAAPSPPPPLPPRDHRNLAPPASVNTLPPVAPLRTSSSSTSLPPKSPVTPELLTSDSPAIEFIRETLYASLGDQLERLPSLRQLLKTDPPRAYFASVAFAILDVALHAVTPSGAVVGVLGKHLTLDDCPPPLRPFMSELVGISRAAQELEAQDNETAVNLVMAGKQVPALRMERVRRILERGIGSERDDNGGRTSVEGKAVSFANRINALSLSMTHLRPFVERQDYVFKVLAGINS